MLKKRVMIIDDDIVFTDELQGLLVSSGYDVVVENDPRTASGSILDIRPQVVLLDVNMPVKSGFDIVNELQYGDTNLPTSIILMTGYYKSSFDQVSKMYRLDKCLYKPFLPLDLIAMIENA